MKSLIIVPPFTPQLGGFYELPLGLMYISASLKEEGYEVDVFDCNHHVPTPLIALREQLYNNYDVILTGGLSVFYTVIESLCVGVQRWSPESTLILGGGLVSSEPSLTCSSLGYDIGVIGEGDLTVKGVYRALEGKCELSSVPGIVYKDSEGVHLTEKPSATAEINDLPLPDYEGFSVRRYLDNQIPQDNYYLHSVDNPRAIPIISSRGCPYGCTFCYQPLTKKYRCRTMDNFFKEIDYLVDNHQVNTLAIIDELFSMKRERIREFCKRIKPYNLKWIVQLRVDSFDESLLQEMKDAGCIYLSLGIESASDKILKSMKKNITVKQINKALKAAMDVGVGVQGMLIFGDVAETEETFQESMDWWEEHFGSFINLSRVSPYPGSPLYKHCLEEGLIKDPLQNLKDGCPPIHMTKIPKERWDVLRETKDRHALCSKWVTQVTAQADGWHPTRGLRRYRISFRCVHCGKLSFINSFYSDPKPLFRIHCRHCNGKQLSTSIWAKEKTPAL